MDFELLIESGSVDNALLFNFKVLRDLSLVIELGNVDS